MDILKYKIVRVVIAIICLVMLFNHLQPTTSAEGAEKVESAHPSAQTKEEPVVTVTAGVGVQAKDDRERIVVVEGSVGVVSARSLVEAETTPEPSSPENNEPIVVVDSGVGVTSVESPSALVGDTIQPDELVSVPEQGSSAPGTDEASSAEADSPVGGAPSPVVKETVAEPAVAVTTPDEYVMAPTAGSLPVKTTVWECSADGQTLFANSAAECDAFFANVLSGEPVPDGVGIGSGWSVTVHSYDD